MGNMMSVSVATIIDQRPRWEEETRNIQQQTNALRQELVRLQSQLEQLSGAMQACDMLIGFADAPTDPLANVGSDT